ncbi:MAG: addiction module protein [Gammaproteobacteria bacterium]|jgi:putative addiction module component (TIGR02574 family)|nr:addiction module protein [Gammaproteobacteria bacterium]MBT4607167.1 addiction module protein [Thiotrichales bacterium]MBT3472463.1 addiction module protein [Gammaproteobacteria bacterium]MBT3968273.1 addiction module protein [Gammaproteobacteria bacterium]MBT4081304.1 addiction module protein [Gammaproteobacteria bacterium]
MDLKQIEQEVIQLSEQERAELVQKLLLSLDQPSVDEIEEDWFREAERRVRELDSGAVTAVSAEQVREKARALLR